MSIGGLGDYLGDRDFNYLDFEPPPRPATSVPELLINGEQAELVQRRIQQRQLDNQIRILRYKQQLLHYGVPNEVVKTLNDEIILQKLLGILNGLKENSIFGEEGISILIFLLNKLTESRQTATQPEKKERYFTIDEEIARHSDPLPEPPSKIQLFLLHLYQVPENKLLSQLLSLDILKSYTQDVEDLLKICNCLLHPNLEGEDILQLVTQAAPFLEGLSRGSEIVDILFDLASLKNRKASELNDHKKNILSLAQYLVCGIENGSIRASILRELATMSDEKLEKVTLFKEIIKKHIEGSTSNHLNILRNIISFNLDAYLQVEQVAHDLRLDPRILGQIIANVINISPENLTRLAAFIHEYHLITSNSDENSIRRIITSIVRSLDPVPQIRLAKKLAHSAALNPVEESNILSHILTDLSIHPYYKTVYETLEKYNLADHASTMLNELAHEAFFTFSIRPITQELLDPKIGSLNPLLKKYHGAAKAELAVNILRRTIVAADLSAIVAIVEKISIPMSIDQLTDYFVWLSSLPANTLARIQKDIIENNPKTIEDLTELFKDL